MQQLFGTCRDDELRCRSIIKGWTERVKYTGLGLPPEKLLRICEAVQVAPSLTELDLTGNAIPSAVCDRLIEALLINSTLVSFRHGSSADDAVRVPVADFKGSTRLPELTLQAREPGCAVRVAGALLSRNRVTRIVHMAEGFQIPVQQARGYGNDR